MELYIEKIFFAIFLLAVLVFFDLLFKFKRPFILKYNLLLIVAVVGTAALIHNIDLYSLKYVFFIILCKALVVSAFLNVFSDF
jgi:hypothetical protein